MKPQPWPRHRAACGPAVLAAAAFLALFSAVPGSVSGQPRGGWKDVTPRADSQPDPARSGSAESGPRASLLADRTGFYSNLGLLDSISREAVNAIADSLTLPPGSEVTLYASTPHEANWFVGSILGEILSERGYQVRILDWGPEVAGATPAPGTAAPQIRPNRQRPAGQQGGQGDGTPADTTAANSDSTQAEADSTQGDPEQGESPEGSQGAAAAGGESTGTAPGAQAGSAATSAPGQTGGPTLRSIPSGEALDLRIVEFGVSYADVGRKLLFGPVRFTRVAGVYLQISSTGEPRGQLRQVISAERHRVDRLSGSQRSLAEGASYPFRIPELKAPGLGRYIEPTVVVGIVGSLVYLFNANQSSK